MLLLVATLNTAVAAKTLTVEETREIEAPSALVWSVVSNYQTWKDWTVWNPEKDPEATWTYEGKAGEVGHSTEWAGPRLGKGKMVSTRAVANTSWQYDLYFNGKDKSYPGGLTLHESNGTTTVAWSFNMKMGGLGAVLFGKKISKMIAADFAGGLENLEEQVEAAHAAARLEAAEGEVAAGSATVEAAKVALAEAQTTASAAAASKAAAESALSAARGRSKQVAAQAELDAAASALDAAEDAKKAAEEALATATIALEAAQAAVEKLKSPGK